MLVNAKAYGQVEHSETPGRRVGMRTLLTCLAMVALVGCSDTTAPRTEPEPDCVPPGPEAEWCHHLDNDAVVEVLLPLPDSAYHRDSPSHSTSLY